jgi:hypothetical protein
MNSEMRKDDRLIEAAEKRVKTRSLSLAVLCQ